MTFLRGTRIRPATASDYPVFVRLFPELEVTDPVMTAEKFALELLPTTLIAEANVAPGNAKGAGAPAVGYAYFQLLGAIAYVRHLVTAPGARRAGVGRSLLTAIADRARGSGCTAWCLNVKCDNEAAIALYERLGFSAAYASHALSLAWTTVDSAATCDDDADHRMRNARVMARILAAEDDARVEHATKLMPGQLATTRALGGRVIMGLFEDEQVAGVTVFDPTFSRAYPFRVVRPELAFVLLRAVRAHARPTDSFASVVCEGEPEVAAALIAAGATVVHDIVHMKAALLCFRRGAATSGA
jgi:ribosomal protein S18 acetylase RimI-like enzyme